MQLVRCNHVLGLRLDVKRVLEQVEDQRQVDLSEVVETSELGAIIVHEVLLVEEAVVPGIIKACSCSQEEKVKKLSAAPFVGGRFPPVVEGVHEETEVVEALVRVQVRLHVVALPEGRDVVIVHRISEVLSIVDVAGEFSNNWAAVHLLLEGCGNCF